MKKISVALFSYNRRDFLKESILSILAQTEKDVEIVIFDNASNFDVLEVSEEMKKYSSETQTIKIEKNLKNEGSVGQYIKVQKYKFDAPYLMIFHDDDTIHPDYLKTCLSLLEDSPDVVWVGSNINFVKNDGDMGKFKDKYPGSFFKVDRDSLTKNIFLNFNIGFGSVIFKTEVYQNTTSIDLMNNEFGKWFDRPFLVSLLGNTSKAFLTKTRYMNYRVHQSQDSKVLNDDTKKYLLNLFSFYKKNTSEENIRYFNRWAFNNSILLSKSFSSNTKDFYKSILELWNKGYFSIRYINLRGIYYIIQCTIKRLNI